MDVKNQEKEANNNDTIKTKKTWKFKCNENPIDFLKSLHIKIWSHPLKLVRKREMNSGILI